MREVGTDQSSACDLCISKAATFSPTARSRTFAPIEIMVPTAASRTCIFMAHSTRHGNPIRNSAAAMPWPAPSNHKTCHRHCSHQRRSDRKVPSSNAFFLGFLPSCLNCEDFRLCASLLLPRFRQRCGDCSDRAKQHERVVLRGRETSALPELSRFVIDGVDH